MTALAILAVLALLFVCRLAYRDAKEADRLEALRGNPPMRDRR